MDHSTPTVSPLRRRMTDDMRMRNFRPKTQAAYLRGVAKLGAFLQRSPDTASAEPRAQAACGKSGRTSCFVDRGARS